MMKLETWLKISVLIYEIEVEKINVKCLLKNNHHTNT